MRYFILLAILLAPTFGHACFAQPKSLWRTDRELVDDASSIILVRADAPFGVVEEGRYAGMSGKSFEVLEVLKGDQIDSFDRTWTTFIGVDHPQYEDLIAHHRSHHSPVFWEFGGGRFIPGIDCNIWPYFLENRTYLIFLGGKHVRAYEEIGPDDDLWVRSTRAMLANANLTRGKEIDVLDWLRLSVSVFVGRIVDCEGPSFEVVRTLHGDAFDSWLFADSNSFSEWSDACVRGQEYVVRVHADDWLSWPQRFSSLHPITDEAVSFADYARGGRLAVSGKLEWRIGDLITAMDAD
ncbi:MAG: hypothetical protein AAF401_03235 [Pseudomonadota bacterium]